MGSLSNLYISQSYTSLIHLGNDTTIGTASVQLQDGLGNSIGVSVNSSGDVSLSGSLSASLTEGYVWVGNSSNRTVLISTSSIGVTTDLSSLNAFTASQETKNTTLASVTASLNANTASQETKNATIASVTSSLNAFTASQEAKDSTLASVTASLNANTASQQSQINSLIAATGSYALTSSIVPLTSLNAFTASQETKDSTLGGITGSFLITASFNDTTREIVFQKQDSSLFYVPIGGGSGSYATTGSNVFNGNQTIYGTLFVSGASSTFRGNSFTVEDSTSAVKFGVYNNVQLVRSLYPLEVQAPFTASLTQGYTWVGNASGVSTLVATSSFGIPLPTGTISGSAQITALGFVSSSITASSIITASVVDDDITFTKGDGSQFTIQVATGSFAVSASYAENAATASIARNVVIIARNGNASTLPAGTVVRITSAVGDNPIFNTASYDDEANSSNTLGILRYSTATGVDSEVVVQGTVLGVNTDPVLGYAAGDILYLSSSGQFTNVQPQAPLQTVTLGEVLRVQQNNGSIYVNVSNGWELNELHNVQITNPATNQLLAYESASYGLWKNKSFNELGLATTGSNTFTDKQTISANGIEITGSVLLTPASVSTNAAYVIPFISGSTISKDSVDTLFYNPSFNQLLVSASATGVANISPNAISFTSGSGAFGTYSAAVSKNGFVSTIEGVGYIAMQANPSKTGAPSLTTSFNPAILGLSSSAQPYVAIELQQSGSGFTDGRVTFRRNVAMLQNLEITGSLTSSLQQGYVWVGDVNGRTTTVATSSFGGGTSDLTSLNAFTASQETKNATLSTYTASVDAKFATIGTQSGSWGGGGAAFPYTGSAQITGSLGVTGSVSNKVNALVVTGTTASLDFSLGNMFTLTLPSASTTYFNPSNIKAGQTINVQLTQQTPGTGSVSFAPSIKFAGGNDYQATATGSAIDLITFISLDGTNVLATSIKNFL